MSSVTHYFALERAGGPRQPSFLQPFQRYLRASLNCRSHLGHTIVSCARAESSGRRRHENHQKKCDLAMLRPLFLKAAGCSMALTKQRCDRLARKRSENVWGWPMSSTKLWSHSSRNAKLRPNWKTKLSSFRRRSKGSRRRITDSSSQKRGELFIRSHNETLPVVAMPLCHKETVQRTARGQDLRGLTLAR